MVRLCVAGKGSLGAVSQQDGQDGAAADKCAGGKSQQAVPILACPLRRDDEQWEPADPEMDCLLAAGSAAI